MNKDFDQAGRAGEVYRGQQFAQSGGIFSTEQVNDANVLAAHNLDIERKNAMRRLNFQEASAGLGQYNSLMSMLGVGSGTALQLGGGFSAEQARAISGLPNTSPGSGALSGGLAGAGAGASFGPWGALIGGALGAAGGYYGSGG